MSSDDDKRIQSINSIRAYGTNKDIVQRKEKIQYNNLIKQYEKWLTMAMLKKKT